MKLATLRGALCGALVLSLAGCGRSSGDAAPDDSARRDSATAGAATPAAPTSAPTTAAPRDTTPVLTPEGWGPLRIGMTRAEVVAAAGEDANPGAVGGADPERCDEFRPARAPRGLLVMIERGRLVRVSLGAGATVATSGGVRMRDSVTAVLAAHGAAGVRSPHKYVAPPGEYITVRGPAAANGEPRGIRYEIGPEARVSRVHAGGPAIEYVEGCL